MDVPKLIQNLYSSDHRLSAFASGSLAAITRHVVANRMVFFPEYTDHGIDHFELVLQTAADLATRAAQALLTPIDATALAVSSALHDFGMHLTIDGFETLISNRGRWPGVSFFRDQPWGQLWEEFYAEATRFDDRKLKALFGNGYRPVRPLPTRGQPWEDFDYLLVGEFLRLHHPRLAHEIAINGLPAKDGNAIEICPTNTEEDRFLADICGLVARSHGMDLRPCLEYLQETYKNRIDPRRTHVAFLCVLLRIADYFQIQAERAPTGRTDVYAFQSQISAREWKVHQCISDISNTGSDPEAIVVIANPKDVETFLRVRDWLNGLQQELDRSWAILGEVYGLQKHTNLDALGLKIRRVKSNLDDGTAFAKGVNYVPDRIAFEAANADLLKLLVGPLYSNDPGIGLRELIQNAIDAVREFEDYALHQSEITSVERYSQSADVVLRLECDEAGLPSSVTITDRGVGMTPQIVREYFLKAGASFRKSNAWRQDHEDSQGHSRVLRTGRFGVGALAAFLLGDEIEVTTRHVFSSSSDGVTFRARLDDEAISLVRASAPAGTRIRIEIPERMREAAKDLVPYEGQEYIHFGDSLGHYFLKKPSLARELPAQWKELKVYSWLPQPTDSESETWRCFSNSEFQKVFWSYAGAAPTLACNGIVIEAYQRGGKYLDQIFRLPNLSVFDRDGYLPVNLQRTGLQHDSLPFEADLIGSIASDLAAHALVELPSEAGSWLDSSYVGFSGRSAALGGFDQWSKWLFSEKAFVPNDPHLLSCYAPDMLIVAVGGPAGCASYAEILRQKIGSNLVASYAPTSLSDTNPRIKGLFRDVLVGRFHLHRLKLEHCLSVIPNSVSSKVKAMRPGKHALQDLSFFDELEANNGWKVWNDGTALSIKLANRLASLEVDDENPTAFCVFRMKHRAVANPSTFSSKWMELFGQPAIPFDESERKALEARVFPAIGKLVELRQQLQTRKRNAKGSSGSGDEDTDDSPE